MSQREPEEGPRQSEGSYEEPVTARPQRPGMDRTPAPASPMRARPRVLSLVLGLFYGGVGVGIVGVVSAFLWRSDSRTGLLDAMAGSTADPGSKQQAADIVLYGSIGALALLLVVEIALIARLGTGRAGARPALTIAVPAHLVVLYLVRDVVRTQGWQGTIIEASLIVQAVVLVAAVALSWLRPMGRWLRRRPAGASAS